MRLRVSTIVGMVIVICGASIVGRVVKVISLKKNEVPEENDSGTSNERKLHNDPELQVSNINKNKLYRPNINNDYDHLIWFLQISDLHLSIFHDEQRILQFQDFVNNTLDVLQPSVVLASGDLIDAKMRDNLGSRQYIAEWKIYQDILKKAKVTSKTVWLDIRGNHDNFDVPSLNSSNNFYQDYSIQGRLHQRSYMYVLKKGQESVSFIGVDACLLPGPRRPFNFIGVLTAKEMKSLSIFKERSQSANYTIWFGHYPTSCIISPNQGLRHLMTGSLAYLCGHLHTLGGFVNNLYTRQQTGSLELELGDWKDNRVFRVAVIDHGMFSFSDIKLNQWPIVIITNPKNALFAMPQNEPLHLISKSTHVRVLVWSDSPIDYVKIRFGDSLTWTMMDHVDGPLYTAPWVTMLFNKGIHTVEVVAMDMNERESVMSQSFSLDGSQPDFNILRRVILMSNVSSVFQFFFGVSLFLCVIPLCVVRWMHYLIKEKRVLKPRFTSWFIKIWIRKICILCSVDKLFWPLICSIIYLPLGPWFIGEVLDGHVGVVFAWGTFVYSSYLPGSLTYCYGFLQMMFYQFPLILISSHCADLRFQVLFMNKELGVCIRWIKNTLFSVIILMQASNAYYFFLSYGAMAMVLGPLRTWSIFLGFYLWYQATYLTPKDLRSVADMWISRNSANVAEEEFVANQEASGSNKDVELNDVTSSSLRDTEGHSTSL